jgi:hypothetical protein
MAARIKGAHNPDYSKALIYGIYDKRTDVCINVGQTAIKMSSRWSVYKTSAKSAKARNSAAWIRNHGGSDNFEMKLIENWPCTKKAELTARENYYIQLMQPACNVQGNIAVLFPKTICACGKSISSFPGPKSIHERGAHCDVLVSLRYLFG